MADLSDNNPKLYDNRKELLTRKQVASRLNISLRQVDNLIEGGKLKVIRISPRCSRVHQCDLEKFIDKRRV